MSLRLTWSSSSSALRCERSFTVITHARCSASTRCTAPTETTAGNAAPSRRWKRASYSPAPDAVACSNAAASSAWRSSGHHGNGVRAPSSSSRANPVISQMRSFTCTITRPPSGSSSVTRTPSAIVSSTRAREVALGTHAPIGLEPLGHVGQREDDTLELALRRPQRTRVLLDPAQLAVRPVDADDHARPRLPVAERQVPRLVEPVDRVARDIDERPVRVCERREHLLLRATEDALHARVRRQDAPVQPEHDQALVERLDDRLVALLRTLATQLRATPLGDVRDHRIEQDPPIVPPESTAQAVRAAGAARNLEPMLEIDGTTAERAVERLLDPFAVVRMDRLEPDRRRLDALGGLVAEHAHEVSESRDDAQTAVLVALETEDMLGNRLDQALQRVLGGAEVVLRPAQLLLAHEARKRLRSSRCGDQRLVDALGSPVRSLDRAADQVSEQLTAGAQWNADDRRDPLLRPEHQLVCETLGLGAEAPRVESQRPVGAPAPDDARNEPPVLHERDLDEIESERVPHAPRQQLDDRQRLVARGDRAHRPQEPQTARSAQVSAGRQPLERVLDRAGGALDDRAAVALGEALARLDADDSRHVRVEARSCQRLDPPDHLDVAGIRADRPLHRDRLVALVGACEQPGAQRMRVDHLVVAALSRQPEAILVLHVYAREKRFADLRTQRRAHRGVGLVGARHPHERAREGAVEAFDIKAHLLQIGQIAPGFTWNCAPRP